jgi:serine/threonine protein kinase/photosystem II stability/assembly factor-like uncharacterized protein
MTCPRCSALIEENVWFCENCGEKIPKPPADPLLGRKLLNEYTITKKIGGGGFGSVYQAEQTAMNRLVAIKVLHKELTTNTQLVKRFHREGMAASKLDHPSAVKMYTSGQTDDGYHWIAMEWLDGESLDKRIRRGPISLGELLEIMGPICDVLAEAHTKGIFHRDLKPENIMLTPYVAGKLLPKLLDFGIAGVTNDRMTLAENSMVVSGTPQYMPPEQWMGLAFTDARTDIYALGVIIYQCLSQKLPFRADTAPAWRQQHCEAEPMELPSVGDTNITPKLFAVLKKALAKDVEARYQTAAAFKEALQNVAKDASPEMQRDIETHDIKLPTPTDPPKAPTPPPTKNKPPVGLIIGAIAGTGTIVIATIAMLGGFGRADPMPSKDFRKVEFSPKTNIVSEPVSQPKTTASAPVETIKQPTFTAQTLRKKESNELLASIVATSENELFAAGDYGRILHSTDAGKTWEALETGVEVWLNGLWIDTDQTIFAAGADGNLLRGSGDKWQTLKSNTTDQLYAVQGIDKNTLLAVGAFGTILRSTNRGDTWSIIRSNTSDELRDIWTDQRGLVIVVGANGCILLSKDFGQTWETKKSPSKQALFSVFGRDALSLYAVGDQGTILASSDGGETFIEKQSGTKEMLNRVLWSEKHGVLIAGNNGLLLRATDGESFTPFVQTLSTQSLYGLTTTASGNVFAVGYNNELLRITPEGSLEELQSGSTPPISIVWGRGASERYAAGAAGSLFRSTDAGTTWSEVNLETGDYLSGLWSSADRLYIVGDQGAFYSSTDGLSWQRGETNSDETLSMIYGAPSGDLFAVGGVGLILHSQDQGKTWKKKNSNSASTLVNLWINPDGVIFVVGLNGTILRSTDNGETWEKQNSTTTANLIGIWGRNNEVFASGESGTILYTNDGGATWQALQSNTKEELWGMWGDEKRLIVVGKKGTALASTDNGKTWMSYTTNTKQNLNFIWGDTLGTIYIAGNNGTLLMSKP